jgi:mono/diheme cytochrome c family protein
MRRGLARPALAAGAAALVALSGCRAKDSAGDSANGKRLFVAKCGSCHTLNRAGSKGTTGPNLDYAFKQSLADGLGQDSVRGMVHQQILYPSEAGRMPAKVVKGSEAWDVASYVAQSAAQPGKDTGILASIGATAKKTSAKAEGGKLAIPADPSGQLAYLVGSATASAGSLELDSQNKSSTPHNIALKGAGLDEKGPVVQGGKTSKITVDVKPGKYTFYCSVPGHEAGGMKGPLTVK